MLLLDNSERLCQFPSKSKFYFVYQKIQKSSGFKSVKNKGGDWKGGGSWDGMFW